MEIVDLYYQNTPNQDNKSNMLSLKDQLASLDGPKDQAVNLGSLASLSKPTTQNMPD